MCGSIPGDGIHVPSSATHCRALQPAETHCGVTGSLLMASTFLGLQHTAVRCISLNCTATCWCDNTPNYDVYGLKITTHCKTLCNCVTAFLVIASATHCNNKLHHDHTTLQNTATPCITLQHTATYCNTLQYTVQ